MKIGDKILCKKVYKSEIGHYYFQRKRWYIINKLYPDGSLEDIESVDKPISRVYNLGLQEIDEEKSNYIWNYFISEEEHKRQTRKLKLKKINDKSKF